MSRERALGNKLRSLGSQYFPELIEKALAFDARYVAIVEQLAADPIAAERLPLLLSRFQVQVFEHWKNVAQSPDLVPDWNGVFSPKEVKPHRIKATESQIAEIAQAFLGRGFDYESWVAHTNHVEPSVLNFLASTREPIPPDADLAVLHTLALKKLNEFFDKYPHPEKQRVLLKKAYGLENEQVVPRNELAAQQNMTREKLKRTITYLTIRMRETASSVPR